MHMSFRRFRERATPLNEWYYATRDQFGFTTVQVGERDALFASTSAPFYGDPNRADHYAEMLAQMKLRQ